MSLNKCFKNGKLKRIVPDKSLARKSLNRATEILIEVERLKETEFLEVAEQRLYQAYFHIVKALLYKDGIKEHSHICTIIYAKEVYKNNFNQALTTMEVLKDLRDQGQYGVEPPPLDKEAITTWLEEGKKFHQAVSKIFHITENPSQAKPPKQKSKPLSSSLAY